MITDRNAVIVWPDYSFRVNSTTFVTSKTQNKEVLRTNASASVYFNVVLNVSPSNRGIANDSSILYNGNNELSTDVMTNILHLTKVGSSMSAKLVDGDMT